MPTCCDCFKLKEPSEFPISSNRCHSCREVYKLAKQSTITSRAAYQARRRAGLSATFTLNLEGKKVCSTCGEDKPKTDFGVAKGMKDGLQCQCKECRKTSRKAYNTSLKGHVQNMVAAARTRAKSKGREFNITTELVAEMWDKQQGKCAVTGVNMVLENNTDYCQQSRHPKCPSIDRVDSSGGYTKDNVRLVTVIANGAMNNWPHEVLTTLALSTAIKHGYTVTPPCISPTTQLQSTCH